MVLLLTMHKIRGPAAQPALPLAAGRALIDCPGRGGVSPNHQGQVYSPEWQTGNVRSTPFILPSSSHRLVIDCATHPINSPTIWHYGLEIYCKSAILRPPSSSSFSLHLSIPPSRSPSFPPCLSETLCLSSLLLQYVSPRIQPSNMAHILQIYVQIKPPSPDCLPAPLSISSHITHTVRA